MWLLTTSLDRVISPLATQLIPPCRGASSRRPVRPGGSVGASKIVKAQGVSRATLYQYLALGDDLTRATAGRERPRQSACASLFIGRLGLGVSPHRQGATCVTPLAGERDRERDDRARSPGYEAGSRSRQVSRGEQRRPRPGSVASGHRRERRKARDPGYTFGSPPQRDARGGVEPAGWQIRRQPRGRRSTVYIAARPVAQGILRRSPVTAVCVTAVPCWHVTSKLDPSEVEAVARACRQHCERD